MLKSISFVRMRTSFADSFFPIFLEIFCLFEGEMDWGKNVRRGDGSGRFFSNWRRFGESWDLVLV